MVAAETAELVAQLELSSVDVSSTSVVQDSERLCLPEQSHQPVIEHLNVTTPESPGYSRTFDLNLYKKVVTQAQSSKGAKGVASLDWPAAAVPAGLDRQEVLRRCPGGGFLRPGTDVRVLRGWHVGVDCLLAWLAGWLVGCSLACLVVCLLACLLLCYVVASCPQHA